MSKDFTMDVKDIFTIGGKGKVLVGKILQGEISIGDTIYAPTKNGPEPVTVLAIMDERFHDDAILVTKNNKLIPGIATATLNQDDPDNILNQIKKG